MACSGYIYRGGRGKKHVAVIVQVTETVEYDERCQVDSELVDGGQDGEFPLESWKFPSFGSADAF